MNWSLTTTDGIPVFTLRGFLSGSDSQRLQGATAWVAARTGPLVLDLQQLQGCNARGEHELGICAEYFGPTVVLCVSDPDHLQLSDGRLLGVPRTHLLVEALATVSRLRRQPLLVSGDARLQPASPVVGQPKSRIESVRRASLERIRTSSGVTSLPVAAPALVEEVPDHV